MHGDAPKEWFRPVTHKFAHLLYDKNKAMAYAKNKKMDLKEIEPGVVGECSPMYADENMASNIHDLYSDRDINANGSAWSGAVPAPPGRNRGFGLLRAVYTASLAGPAAVEYISGIGNVEIDQQQAEKLLDDMFAPLDRMEGTTTDEIETRIKT